MVHPRKHIVIFSRMHFVTFYVYNMHQDTKSARLIAVCKRTFTLTQFIRGFFLRQNQSWLSYTVTVLVASSKFRDMSRDKIEFSLHYLKSLSFNRTLANLSTNLLTTSCEHTSPLPLCFFSFIIQTRYMSYCTIWMVPLLVDYHSISY